jgi:hypothetical protein
MSSEDILQALIDLLQLLIVGGIILVFVGVLAGGH